MATPKTPVKQAAPFIKWAGGKGRLLRQYQPFFPDRAEIDRYYEPFIGSASVFFYLQPLAPTLADVNEKLVEVYKVVRDHVEDLIPALQKHKNENEYYYQIRALNPAGLSPVERAARIIFLNKTCYNGLYRENSRGEFNVPFGRYKNPKISDPGRLRAASEALQGAKIVCADFATVVSGAGTGDFVYFDPPYVPLNATSSFTAYNQHGFGLDDHRRLAETFNELDRKGCRVMLSNSSAPLVYELYGRKGFNLIKIKARRSINSKAEKRGPVDELLITNYDR